MNERYGKLTIKIDDQEKKEDFVQVPAITDWNSWPIPRADTCVGEKTVPKTYSTSTVFNHSYIRQYGEIQRHKRCTRHRHDHYLRFPSYISCKPANYAFVRKHLTGVKEHCRMVMEYHSYELVYRDQCHDEDVAS